MKLLTQELIKKIPALYSQDGKGDEAIAYAKFFTPWNYWTWYVTEYDPETGQAFGLVDGDDKELGYFNVNELQAYVHPRTGLTIERDRYFDPKTVGELK